MQAEPRILQTGNADGRRKDEDKPRALRIVQENKVAAVTYAVINRYEPRAPNAGQS